MNFSHRCACALCFIFGIIFSMVLNQLFNSGQGFVFSPMSSNSDVLNSLTDLKETVNKLVIKTEYNGVRESETPSIRVIESMKKLKLFCWVLTGPKNHATKAMKVKNTWGKRCDKLFFISTTHDANLPTTVLKGAKEGRKGLWSKTRGAFKLLYDKYLDKFDFVLKADDDTFVIVENLRYLLKDYNSSVPNYFGCDFQLRSTKKRNLTRWNSGGAGYVLSKAAVKALVEKGYNHSNCRRSIEGGAEDINIARCLQAINITSVDTRDKSGRYKFNGYPASYHLTPGALPKWWGQYIKYPQKSGFDCCSDRAITFHYITPSDMMLYEYLLYRLRPYGVVD